jgi:hypothetical protein
MKEIWHFFPKTLAKLVIFRQEKQIFPNVFGIEVTKFVGN